MVPWSIDTIIFYFLFSSWVKELRKRRILFSLFSFQIYQETEERYSFIIGFLFVVLVQCFFLSTFFSVLRKPNIFQQIPFFFFSFSLSSNSQITKVSRTGTNFLSREQEFSFMHTEIGNDKTLKPRFSNRSSYGQS